MQDASARLFSELDWMLFGQFSARGASVLQS